MTAQLSHLRAEIKVMYQMQYQPYEVKVGDLVEIIYEKDIRSYSGALIVSGLSVLTVPSSHINLFHTVPRSWLKQRALILSAAELFEELPNYFKALLNGIFWEADRFKRFLMGPSSLKGHHDYINGNLIHTLDVIERAMSMSARTPKANLGIVMMGEPSHKIRQSPPQYFCNTQLQNQQGSPSRLLNVCVHGYSNIQYTQKSAVARLASLRNARHVPPASSM